MGGWLGANLLVLKVMCPALQFLSEYNAEPAALPLPATPSNGAQDVPEPAVVTGPANGAQAVPEPGAANESDTSEKPDAASVRKMESQANGFLKRKLGEEKPKLTKKRKTKGVSDTALVPMAGSSTDGLSKASKASKAAETDADDAALAASLLASMDDDL